MFSASSSTTHGPAMIKNRSGGKSRDTLFGCFQHGPPAFRPGAPRFGSCADEACKQRVRSGGTRLQLGVKLATDEPRVRLKLDYLDERSVWRDATECQAMLDKPVAIAVGNF